MKKKNVKRKIPAVCVFPYLDRLIRRKRSAGKESTADLYRASCNWLRKFRGNDKLLFSEITPALVDGFYSFLCSQEYLATNSINSYMSNFRAMYNIAVREEMALPPAVHPFAHLTLHAGKTVKRAIRLETIKEIASMDMKDEPGLETARDYCIFSFLGCGIPFVDLSHLTHDNIVGEELVYNRIKTGTLIRVRITSGMRYILGKYVSSESPYLFPALTLAEGKSSHEAYKRDLRQYNRNLQAIGERLSVPVTLTSYVFRHTWATEALRCHTPVAVISQALGHTSEKTTRNYLAFLDQSELDAANRIVTREVDCLMRGRRA